MALKRYIGTAAQRLVNAVTGSAGDLWFETDTGDLGVADGSRLLKYTSRLAKRYGDVQADAFIDFSTKPDGDPPAFMDTGHPVTFTQSITGYKGQVSSGKLVHGTLPGTAVTYATYYQANLGGVKGRRIGCRYVWPTSPTANGTLCIALWATAYTASGGGFVPSSVAHLTITPGTGATGAWAYYVCDGLGNGSTHFFIVKSGTYANPATDDTTPWLTEIEVDREAGLSTVFLPDGTIATVSAAEVAAKFTALGTTPVAFASLGAEFAMIEHFATTNGNTAVYPEMKQFWADTTVTSASHRTATRSLMARSIKAALPPVVAATKITYSPTTAFTLATTTSPAYIDNATLFLAATAGPTGVVRVFCTAYYEFTSADTLFLRIRDSISAATSLTATANAHIGTAGQHAKIPHVMELTGLTPYQAVVLTLQHWSASAGSATVKAGGSGATYPVITLDATPL